MREILFRIKSFDEWFYGYPMSEIKNNNVSFSGKSAKDGSSFFDMFADATTLGEYTGLNDRNGNKIFEDDIIKHENYVGRIEFFGGGFGLKNIPQWVEKSAWFILNNCEVIGNIYDNPELLKQ